MITTSRNAVHLASSSRSDVPLDCDETDARMWTALNEITELLGAPATPDVDLDAALVATRHHAEQVLLGAVTTDARRVAACQALYRVHQIQTQRLNRSATEAARSVSEVRRTLDDVLDASTAQLVTEIPTRICRGLSFSRAMLSSVSSAVWLPKYLHFECDDSPENAAFRSYVTGAQIPLAEAPLEASIVRTRAPSMSAQPEDDRRTFKEIVTVARTVGYVATPIVSRGRVIGMLHADRPTDRRISDTDLALVATLSECLSSVFERAILADRLTLSAARVDELFGDITAELSDLDLTPGKLSPISTSTPSSPVTARPAMQAALLTPREREVLGHMATGATNAQIARSLVVSEETVKSHVKQIAKKLGTSTRSAAVAKFAHLGGQFGTVTPR